METHLLALEQARVRGREGTDGSRGSVSLQAVARKLAEVYRSPHAAFLALDAHRDGIIDPEEVAPAPNQQQPRSP
jgi:hypothetical protein